MKPNQGFTLIELVVVIVILGILAATALPKFVDLGKDARIAALHGLRGTIADAAAMAHAKCAVSTSTCAPSWNYFHTPRPSVEIGGTTFNMHYGYPENESYGIGALAIPTGFTFVVAGDYTSYFTKDGAPSPTTCRVSYTETHTASETYVPGRFPEILVTDTGC